MDCLFTCDNVVEVAWIVSLFTCDDAVELAWIVCLLFVYL